MTSSCSLHAQLEAFVEGRNHTAKFHQNTVVLEADWESTEADTFVLKIDNTNSSNKKSGSLLQSNSYVLLEISVLPNLAQQEILNISLDKLNFQISVPQRDVPYIPEGIESIPIATRIFGLPIITCLLLALLIIVIIWIWSIWNAKKKSASPLYRPK
ncbi:hypothetical protein Glove_326g171 [Diversispora epigaea]|uniref:Uncharacterized protein n=1 Tax=Diversispora epigaea TaxID=1348612 RepID=A0A397HM50_9GLOM|nr:hypothetical protein Glove_326g171 [Diversispora epigaea]